MAFPSDEQKWMLASTGSAVAAAGLVRFLLERGWERASGHSPPKNAAAPGVNWTEALVWGIGTGVAASLARVVARRAAAESWTHLRGGRPRALRRQSARA